MAQALHPNPQVGRGLAWLRQRANLRQIDVGSRLEAEGTSVSAVWLSQVERGRRQPSWRLVHALLDAYGVTLGELDALLVSQPWRLAARQTVSFGAAPTDRLPLGARAPQPRAAAVESTVAAARRRGAVEALPADAAELSELLSVYLSLGASQRVAALAAVAALRDVSRP